MGIWVFLFLMAVGVIGLDQLTKLWVHIHGLYIPVFEDFLGIQFAIRHTINYGAAWGLFSDFQYPLLIARLLLIGGMLFYLIKGKRPLMWRAPLTLIIAGALSNVLDFFFYGHVVDMIHFTFWSFDYPVFNIADSAVFLGVAWLALIMTFSEEKVANGH